MKHYQQHLAFSVLFSTIAFVNICVSQWSTNSTINTAVSTATSTQQKPKAISDGSGGIIIVWRDYRNGNYDIYAQKINSSGQKQWSANDVAVCTATGSQQDYVIVSDGSGGAIIAWEDSRNGGSNPDIYAQRINSSGEIWAQNGIAVCDYLGYEEDPIITTNGSGGAIIAWRDYRGGNNYDIYGQSLTNFGLAQWADDGVPICSFSTTQENLVIASDGQNGAVVVWQDYNRGIGGSNYDIYAQRISSSSSLLWSVDGIPIYNGSAAQITPSIVLTSDLHFIIAWADNRNGNYDVYAQKINNSGNIQWDANAVEISAAPNAQEEIEVVADNDGGGIVVWTDRRLNYDLYAQKLNSLGATQWTSNGVAVCSQASNEYYPKAISDGAGGVIVTWEDYRSGVNIYAQRINDSGTNSWTLDGVGVCTQSSSQYAPVIVSDGASGAIITWEDNRSSGDVYAQNICGAGIIGGIGTPAQISGNISVCGNSTNIYSITAVPGATSYNWALPSGWSGSSTSNSISANSNDKGGLISVSASNACGTSTASTFSVTIRPTSITGTVRYDNNTITGNSKSYAKAFLKDSLSQMILLDSVTISNAGTYMFSNLGYIDTVIVYAQVDTSLYPMAVGTYYESTYDWTKAKKVIPTCATTSANITIVERSALTGSNKVSGRIVEGQGFGKKDAAGDGIGGIELGLKKKVGGQLSSVAITDANGSYEMENVADGEYEMYINMPGLPIVSNYTVTLSASNREQNSVDFEVDSNKIEKTILSSIGYIITKNGNSIKVLPNPSNGRFSIYYSEGAKPASVLKISNSLGEEVFTQVIKENIDVSPIDFFKMSKGVYYISLQTNENIVYSKFIID